MDKQKRTKEVYPAEKLRLKGGRKVSYNGQSFSIGKAQRSTRAGKKYMVEVVQTSGDKPKKKLVHYGSVGYQDYNQHKDKARRKNFLARHQGIKKSDGSLAHKDPMGASYHATRSNWSKKLFFMSDF